MSEKMHAPPTFIAALFTVGKTSKQPKCPSTEEWIKMWYIYTMEYSVCVCVCVCVFSCSVVSDSAIPWIVACQDPLSMGFSGKKIRVGIHSLL